MPLSLFDTLKANMPGAGLRPATDSRARVMTETDETVIREFRLRDAQAFYKDPDNERWNFTIDDRVEHNAGWVATLTQKRLLIWSPLAPGLLGVGRMKQKPGKSTGGQLRFAWVDEIARDGTLNLVLKVDNHPEERIKSMLLSLDFADAAQAHDFAVALADALAAFHRNLDADTSKLDTELDKLRNHDWTGGDDLGLSLLRAGATVKYPPR